MSKVRDENLLILLCVCVCVCFKELHFKEVNTDHKISVYTLVAEQASGEHLTMVILCSQITILFVTTRHIVIWLFRKAPFSFWVLYKMEGKISR